MTPWKRILCNTSISYTKSIFSILLSLFTMRWIYDALGAEQFGLFSVVGSVVLFVTFFNGIIANASTRYIAYTIGSGQLSETRKWFNTALCVHLGVALILVTAGWPVGEILIRNVLSIPAGQETNALWVFRFSLITAFIFMSTAPISAMFNAKQKIAIISALELSGNVLLFCFALWLLKYAGNRLFPYALFLMCNGILFKLSTVLIAFKRFPECRIKFEYWKNTARYKALFSYTFWAFSDSIAILLRQNLTAVLLNVYYGTRLNAAYGIANSVVHHTASLAGSLQGAVAPQVSSLEGAGKRADMITMSLQACRMMSMLTIFLAVPLLLNMEYVLTLWLKNPPDYSVSLCFYMLLAALVAQSTAGYRTASEASGKIAVFKCVEGTLTMGTVLSVAIFFACGLSPVSLGWAFTLGAILVAIGRVECGARILAIPRRLWVLGVLRPTLILLTSGVLSGLLVKWYFSEKNLFDFIVVSVTSALAMIVMGYWVGLTSMERADFWRIVVTIKQKTIAVVRRQKREY